MCLFVQVLLLDSDNLPLVNPEHLFDTQEYRQHGALFFPDWWASTLLFKEFHWATSLVTHRHTKHQGSSLRLA